MTGLKKMIGLPVILDGHAAGSVLRGVLQRDGRSLRGLVVRGGLKGARWLPREQIRLVGQLSVIGSGQTLRLPQDADYCLFRVSDGDGTRLGVVTDALLQEETLRVAALEISAGPVDDLTEGRWYATAFSVHDHGGKGHVTILQSRGEVNL